MADVRRLRRRRRARSACRCWRRAPAPARASTSCATRSPRRVARQEGHPRPARGRRARAPPRRLQEASGTSAHPELSPGADRRARGRASPTPPGCRRSSRPSSRATRLRADRATGWPVTSWLVAAAPRPAQAAAPRPRQGRPRASPAAGAPRCRLPRQVQRAARRHRGARRRRRGVGAAGPAVGRVRAPRLGRAPARPQRPPRLRAGRHRPRRRPGARSGPGWCGCSSGCCCSPRSPALVWSAVLLADPCARRRPAVDPRRRRLPGAGGPAARRGRARAPAGAGVPAPGRRRRRARGPASADRRLRAAIAEVADELVVGAGRAPSSRRTTRSATAWPGRSK